MANTLTQQIYDYAEQHARDNKFFTIDTRQYLLALVNVKSSAQSCLAQYGITKDNTKFVSDGMGKGTLTYSQDVGDMNRYASSISTAVGANDIEPIHILIAILSLPQCYANQHILYKFHEDSSRLNALCNSALALVPNSDRLLPNATPTQTAVAPSVVQPAVEVGEDIAYGKDMTAIARQGGYDPVIGRDNEITRIIQILSRRTKNNPVLVGNAGVGKSAVVEGLAQCIAEGNVPSTLFGKRVVELDIASMIAGTRYRGDFEERLKNTINQVVEDGNTIIFIDEIHNIVGAGGNSDGSMDAVEILKPLLARGALHTIGATTIDEYRKYIEKDPALERRFQPVKVDEPTQEQAVQILMGVKSRYEQHHGLTISDSAVQASVALSVRYIPDRYLPDKAFDLLDESASKVRLYNSGSYDQSKQLINQLNAIKAQRDKARDSGDINAVAQYTASYNKLYAQYSAINTNAKGAIPTVEVQDVAEVVSQWTGVPVTELTKTEKDKLLQLEHTMSAQVVGQQSAVTAVSRAIRRARAGIKSPNRPIGSFIFVGPTGVGKTELAKAIAGSLFGNSDEVIRIDMSEYMDKQSVSKLIGSAPGYVGYEEGGVLTERVYRKPYSVVLFDEIEKAHADVFNLLLQILDEGRLSDNHGKVVDFCNTIIILTSNLGASISSGMGFGGSSYTTLQNNCLADLRRHFRPEFLNRLDEVIVFAHLTREEIKEIAKLMCHDLVKRLRGIINLKFTDRCIEHLATVGYDQEYGARPLRRCIQREVEDLIAEQLLKEVIRQGEMVTVDVVNDKVITGVY